MGISAITHAGALVEISRARIVRLVVGASQTLDAAVRRADELGGQFDAADSAQTLGCAPLGLKTVVGRGTLIRSKP